jgi:hypothetical protein
MPPMPITPELREAAKVSKAWPYEEARKLLKRYPDGPPDGRAILFETGYGPSGLPHLGTFQEVARTQMVRHALTELTDWPTRLVAFSDDMDGLRKVPPHVPDQAMMLAHMTSHCRPCPIRSAAITPATPRTTMRCCGNSSTASASTMNFSPPANATAAGASTKRCGPSCATMTRSWA